MKFFYAFCLFFFGISCQVSLATTSLEGVVERQGPNLTLTMSRSGLQYSLFARSRHVMLDLQKLEAGDYLSGEGVVYDGRATIEVTAVKFVGLRKMLGIWRTTDWKVFNFKNFSRLDLYLPDSSISSQPVYLRSLRYTVAPDNGDTWSILIVDSRSVDVGSLSVDKDSMRIRVFDPKTGNIAQTIHLSPVQWQSQFASPKLIH